MVRGFSGRDREETRGVQAGRLEDDLPQVGLSLRLHQLTEKR